MGNVLTWRDVAAPDLSGAMYGYKVAGDNITQAGKGFSDALGAFDTYRKNEAGDAIYRAAMGYKDEAAMRAALADGSLYANAGVNPALVTAEANKALDNRASLLLNQAATGLQNMYNTRTMDDRVKAIGLANASTAASTAGQLLTNEYNTKTMDDRVQASGLANQATAASTADQIRRTKEGATTFEDNQSDRQQTIDAQKAAEIAARSSTNYTDAIAHIAGNKDIDENTRVQALKLLPGLLQAYNPSAAPALPGQPGSNPASAPAAIAGAAGAATAAPVPSSSFVGALPATETRNYVSSITGAAGDLSGLSNAQKIDRLMPYLVGQESGGQHTNADGSLLTSPKGAQGITQVMRKTGEDPGFGVKPLQNQSKEEYLRFGREYLGAMLDRYHGNVEAALAAYNAGPGTVDKVLAFHPDVLRAENAQLSGQASQAIAKAAAAVGQGNAPGLAGQYSALQNDQSTRDQTVAAMRSQKGGLWENVDADKIASQLDKIMERGTKAGVTLNPAQAAALLNRYGSPKLGRWFGARNSADIADSNGLDQELKAMATGTRFDGSNSNNVVAVLAQNVQQAQATQQAALKELQTAQQASLTRPDVAKNLPRLHEQYTRATQLLRQAVQKIESNKQAQPQFAPPAAVAPMTSASAAPAISRSAHGMGMF